MLVFSMAAGFLGFNQTELHCDRTTCTLTQRIPDRTYTVSLAKVHEAKAIARPKAGAIDAVLLDDAGVAVLRVPTAKPNADRVVGELGELIAGTRTEVHHVEPPSALLIAAGALMLVIGLGAFGLGIQRHRQAA